VRIDGVLHETVSRLTEHVDRILGQYSSTLDGRSIDTLLRGVASPASVGLVAVRSVDIPPSFGDLEQAALPETQIA
jgi:hypothetical protein